jgi:hypothetical protein
VLADKVLRVVHVERVQGALKRKEGEGEGRRGKEEGEGEGETRGT